MNSIMWRGARLWWVGVLAAGWVQAGSFSKEARGTSAATFLSLPGDARSAAMGGAAVALDGAAGALTWNPAGLATVKSPELLLGHSPLPAGSSHSNAVYAHPAGAGVWAGGYSSFAAGSIDETNDAGAATGQFRPLDGVGTIGYARTIGEWSAGVAGKYVTTKIVESDSTWAVDLGVQSPLVLKDRVRWGALLRNIGDGLQLGATSRPLPLEIVVGGVIFPTPDWTVAADARFPRDNDPIPVLGIEGRLPALAQWRLSGRAGWNGKVDSGLGDMAGLTLGFGLDRKAWGLDYAFSPLGDLGNGHQISLVISFP